MPTILNTIAFKQELLPLVAGFDCAQVDPPEFWEAEINQWIKLDPASGDGALYWLAKGTDVWLYTNERDEVVGYGSLCGSKWPDPAVVKRVPKLPRVPISLIPAVGVDRRFQSSPAGAEPAERYAVKIMNHLIFEARQHAELQPFLGLYVHPRNEKAIRFYRRFGFVDFAQTHRHAHAGVE